MAECSESAGRILILCFFARGRTYGPPAINVSLFARAISFPASIAATVGCSPQNPPLRIAKRTLKLRHQIVSSHLINKIKRKKLLSLIICGLTFYKMNPGKSKARTLDTIASPKKKKLDKTQHDRPQWKGSTS